MNATVLTLPGWQNSGSGHWQTHWEALHGFRRVEQPDWLWPRRGDWMARLDEVLLQPQDGPPRSTLLAAHSLGCHLVAAWAAHTRHAALVHGALLVAPPDLARNTLPPQLAGWRPGVTHVLPFPAMLVYSDDDPYADAARSREMAAAWGATPRSIGCAGHINGDSGLADWPEGLVMLRQLAPREGRV